LTATARIHLHNLNLTLRGGRDFGPCLSYYLI
jgi:hypothetical protein